MFVCSNEIQDRLLKIFQQLHQTPEISWEERETTKIITDIVEKEGCKVSRFENHTGLIAEIGSGKPVIAIRADMDALWQEVDGIFQANHSCGHDAHMTIVLGVLFLLKNTSFKGTVRFIFQPAEEKGQGALSMVDKQIVDDVDYLFGVHLRPYQEVPNGYCSPMIIHGACRFINGNIIGDDLHGARPHLGANAIEIGATLDQMLKTIHIDPLVPSSVKLTKFQAGGESSNIIPGNAEFSIDMRAQTNEAMEKMQSKIDLMIDALERFYEVKIPYQISSNVPAAVTNEDASDILKEAIFHVLGSDRCVPPIQTTGGDDFHYYKIKRPELKATMLGLGCDLKPGLHHPNMTFDQRAIFTGSTILATAVNIASNK
ncbi:M20 peptidase aminoacylase family protein [Heyndrickxia oleronia]|uniref:M20 peptidase aminoacylase family protein n=1 Tax=Heyndrickxia oleronia TaxID=38875 RepID=A0AAW6SRD1_9BACI|nr:M20 peptidase aminoacylase family protein [Heyndrickxia oleronia]MDH5159382.1 M20 peptidase aminoacylase family protein [Heyndrickxia oleronia]